MAEFLPPNLDNEEEVWLPKRFEPNNNNNNNRPLPLPPLLMDMDDLAHHFTTFTLLQRNHPTTSLIPPPPKSFQVQRFRQPPVRSDPFAISQHGYLTANGGGLDVGLQSLTAYETGAAFSVAQRPFYQYHHHLLEPPQTHEVESIVRVREARILQSQQNQSQNRIFPVQGSHVRVGRVVRKSEGTGVFLPRIAATTFTTTTTTTTSNELGHKQGVRSRQETQMNQPRNSMSRIAMGKHEADCHCQLCPEMDLPQDWTY